MRIIGYDVHVGPRATYGVWCGFGHMTCSDKVNDIQVTEERDWKPAVYRLDRKVT